MRAGWPVATLPGPRRHLADITADLDAGLSCLWLVPEELVSRGMADRLLGELSDRSDSVVLPPPSGPPVARTRVWSDAAESPSIPPPEWATDKFGLFGRSARSVDPVRLTPVESLTDRLVALVDAPRTTATDPLEALVARGMLGGRVLILRAWERGEESGDVGSLFTRLSATAKAHGGPLATRPRMLVAARERDLPAGLADRLDPTTAQAHWWWGAVGRLDTAVVVTTYRPRAARRNHSGDLVERVAIEVLTEVAGPDLTLAEHLAVCWDGRITTLREQLDKLTYDLACPPVRRTTRRMAGFRPPAELRPGWEAGVVDLWDGRVRISPAAPTHGEALNLDLLIWSGQNRALMPVIDEHRAHLERVVRSRASMAALAAVGDNGPDLNGETRALELGVMAQLVHSRSVSLSRGDRNLLYELKRARNRLAHLCALTDQDLDALIEVLPNDSG